MDSTAGIVERTVSILDAFADGSAALGLSELSRRSGLPKPTVHRIAAQLVEQGLLERHGDRYQLGFRLFELGQLVPRSRVLREAALPFLEDLYVASRETVHLAVPDGRFVVYLDKIAGHRSGRTPSRIAGRMPMHSTATGKAILAHSTGPAVDDYVARPLERFTPYTIVVPGVLRTDLAAIRARGWAAEREETASGWTSVAAAVLDRDGMPLAALSVTGPVSRLDPDRYGPAVRTAARGLARSLGAP